MKKEKMIGIVWVSFSIVFLLASADPLNQMASGARDGKQTLLDF